MTETPTACPNCGVPISKKIWVKRAGQLTAAMRKSKRGYPAKERQCPFCKEKIVGLEKLAEHKRGCPKKPRQKGA